MISATEFAKGRIRVPIPLRADAYTVSSEFFASPKAKEKSVYNFTNRRSPKEAFPEVASDSRMVFFGLSQYIRNQLTDRVTYDDIRNSREFMKTAHAFGGELPFPDDLWYPVIHDYDGYLPIKIEALPEGSTFFPNEPVIQVTSLASGYGELAAYIEAIMLGMVSIATARATLERHWLNQLKSWVAKDLNTTDEEVIYGLARFLIHDFGMRAASSAEESELQGLAHLLIFHGTDTFNAAYQAMQMGAERPTGTSILALAHRIVQGYGSDRPAFESLRKVAAHYGDQSIGSYVADCYNYERAITDELVKMAQKYPKHTFVGRPDSGDYVETVFHIVSEAIRNGLYEGELWNKTTPKNLKFIQGDSGNPRKVREVLMRLDGVTAPTLWGVYGIGGYLRNTPTRDSLSSAYKLAAIGSDDEPVVKLSKVAGKMSVPGPSEIIRTIEPYNHPTVFLRGTEPQYMDKMLGAHYAYREYYNGAITDDEKFRPYARVDFRESQKLAIESFDSFSDFSRLNPDAGLNRSLLADEVKQIQDKVMAKYNDKPEACEIPCRSC